MFEPKLISPLLDGFVMGAPMSNHDGVRCCPAMKEGSEDKYIVKVISIPASQRQLDALLLTGAYSDSAAAVDYFKSLADGVTEEVETLEKLSKLEGFLPFDGCQVVSMEDNRLGYDVYLLTTYKRSLEKFMRRNPMTHLAAVNLGLDMCAALAICRNAGYLYVDLQPANIFISEDKEYRIGDLGFVPLSSLKYASLPSKYRSVYTPPELHDPMATLNTTMDTYAAGLILYQVYNNGELPFMGQAPQEPLPSPLNADYEIAEIILKACDPDPANRWKNPIEMGQALVAYMQRNVINDVAINPPKAEVIQPNIAEGAGPEAATEEKTPAELAFMKDLISDETAPEEEDATGISPEEMTEEVSSMLALATDLVSHETPGPVTEPEVPTDKETSEEFDPSENTDSREASVEEEYLPESAKAEAKDEEDEEEEVSATEDDRKTMVLHGTPAPKKPRFVIFDDDDEEDEEEEEEDEDEDSDLGSDRSFETGPRKKKKRTGLIIALVLILLLAALGVGVYYFYNNYYILDIQSISVDGAQNSMVVTIETEIDTSLLTVVCSDSYGNTKRSAITNGKAVFNDLTPNTMYQIQLEVDGFHQLVGPDYSSYTTAAETVVMNFAGVTGGEDGSVVLSFTVEGPEKEWNVVCSAEGEDDRVVSFTGHSVTVTGLTVGKTYTFTLVDPSDTLYIVGTKSVEFTASPIVLAQNLRITACGGGSLTAQWSAPADTSVESWIVNCIGDDGSTFTATVTEPTATFDGLNVAAGYTVEVAASGMTQIVRANVTKNAVTIKEVTVDESDPESITVNWTFGGAAPADGWRVMYSLDNSETLYVVPADTNSATIAPRIPGATYSLRIYAADGTTVFNDVHTYGCPNAKAFDDYKLTAKNIVANLLPTPTNADWSYKDVDENDFAHTFKSGQSISILLHHQYDFYIPRDQASILYVIRDSEGNVLPELVDYSDNYIWNTLWVNTDYHYCELDIPSVPKAPGNYKLYLYINGYAICTLDFTITD